MFSNVFDFFPETAGNDPTWLIVFVNGWRLKHGLLETKISPPENGGLEDDPFLFWLVATQIFLEFSLLILGKWSNLTSIFFRWVGWNHQLIFVFRPIFQVLSLTVSYRERLTQNLPSGAHRRCAIPSVTRRLNEPRPQPHTSGVNISGWTDS